MHMLQSIKTGCKIKCLSLVASLGHMREMRMNVKHLHTVARPLKLRYIVLNSSKSKTRLKFMKLDMISWNGIEMQLMHENVKTNPEKSQKLTQHSCCSMLT